MTSTKNPYNKDSHSHNVWRRGWDAHQSEAAKATHVLQQNTGYEHPECEDCTEQLTRTTSIKIKFEINYVGDKPAPSDITMALTDALPKEWWAGHNCADWGLVTLYPLDDEGQVLAVKW